MPILHLVRHAQPDFHGDYDSITALGRDQAAWLGAHYSELGVRFDRSISGRLKRQRQTLEVMLAEMSPSPAPQLDARFDEYDADRVLSLFAGHQAAAVRASGDRRAYFKALGDALLTWSRAPAQHEGCETWTQFGARVRGAVEDSQAGLVRDARILVVTSGGVIGRLVADILDADAEAAIALNLQTRNTGITEIVFGRSARRLIAFNSVPHLQRPGRMHALTHS
jgi:broad specificity phosphatase PhoE